MNIKTANRLCELRKQMGYSQEELANKLGVSRQAVSKWERSESSPDTDNLIELAKLYNISLDELLNGEDAIELINENKEANEQLEKTEVRPEGITITDDENQTVQFLKDKVIITKKDGTTEELSKEQYKEKLYYKKHPVLFAIAGLWTVALVICYVVLGFCLESGFKNYWFLLILIPVLPSIFGAIREKKTTEFAFAVLIAAIYCGICVFTGLWHPLWVLFLTIPVYYILAKLFDKLVLKTPDEDEEDED